MRERCKDELCILRLNQSFLSDLVLTIRTACRFAQHKLVWTALAGHFSQTPVERNFGIGSTMTSSMLGLASSSSPSKPLSDVHSSVSSSYRSRYVFTSVL